MIAGLIGLGLVAALVLTRGSLSEVYGTAATQMASAGAEGASAPQPVVVPYNARWSTKTVSSRSTGTDASGAPVTIINYTDGSHVRYQAAYTAANGTVTPETIRFTSDGAVSNAQVMQSGFTDKNGVVQDPVYTAYKYNYPSMSYSQVVTNRLSSDGINYQTTQNYNTSGVLTSTSSGKGSVSTYQNNLDDAAYFNKYVASLSQ